MDAPEGCTAEDLSTYIKAICVKAKREGHTIDRFRILPIGKARIEDDEAGGNDE